MSLLQIAEPGQSPDPHTRKVAIGIDLGTTHSLVAAVRNGVAECLPDSSGSLMLPSAVRYLPDGRRDIGAAALTAQADDPLNTVTSAKRLLGRALAEIDVASQSNRLLAHSAAGSAVKNHTENGSRQIMLDIPNAGIKSPLEVSAEILATLRQRAEDSFDDDVFGAVITVPAYFDDAQRQATRDAAEMAGLHVLRLLNEPTAAALAYGLDGESEGIFAVYDLGGGTFDISILRLNDGVFEVLATGGDTQLGGDDYDRTIVSHWLKTLNINPTSLSAADTAMLHARARHAKEQLTENEQTACVLHLNGSDHHCPGMDMDMDMDSRTAADGAEIRAHTVTLSRSTFYALTEELTARTLRAVAQAMQDAEASPDDIQGVVMVGGSTRMPQVRQAVQQHMQCPLFCDRNPDEIVALGAAIQANQLAGNATDTSVLLLDVTPLSLGLETMGGLVERIIPRNQTIPISMAQDFTTAQDGQTALAVHVVQGERDLVQDCRSLARFELRGIPPMAAGAAHIRVTFSVDADGLLTVSAREEVSGIEATVDVKPSYGLSEDEIARMLQDGFATAQQDMQARAVVEAQVDGRRLLAATQSALDADGSILDADERAAIAHAMQTLASLTETETKTEEKTEAEADTDTENGRTPSARPAAADIEAASRRLAQATESFAARRMNLHIQKALTGRTVDNI